MKCRINQQIMKTVIIFALVVATGFAAANNNGPQSSKSDFKWLCQAGGGTFEDGLNYYQCRFANGDKVTCSKDTPQCETCINGKCTVSKKDLAASKDALEQYSKFKNPGNKPDLKMLSGVNFAENGLSLNGEEIQQASDLALMPAANSVSSNVSSFRLSTSSYASYQYKNGVSLWLNLLNGDSAVIRFHEMDEVLPENSYQVKFNGKNHYYVHFWVNKLDTNFDLLSTVKNVRFYYHFLTKHAYLGVSGTVKPGFANAVP